MATVSFFDHAVDMSDPDLTSIAAGTVVSHSSSEVDFTQGPAELDVHGRRFADFDANGAPQSGTILGLDLSVSGAPLAAIGRLHLDVGVFRDFVAAQDDPGLVAYLLQGNDHISGSTEGDVLIGLGGRDSIAGRNGDDTISGGAGGDRLTGGAGRDVFVFTSIDDSGPLGVDTVTDLQAADRIDLSAIDADSLADGDQGFHIVARLRGHAGEMTVGYNAAHDWTIVSLDVDGDGHADGTIRLSGDHHDFASWVL